ncbi:MAG: hypothetical protein AAGI22_20245 [Planctomycetota bacterium]
MRHCLRLAISVFLLSSPLLAQEGHRSAGELLNELPSLDELFADRVLIDRPGDGAVWAHGRDWKASFGDDGFTFIPFLGSDAPRNEPVRIELQRAELGGEPLPLVGPRFGDVTEERVALLRGALREVYRLAPEGVEQTFEIDALPSRSGPLVLRAEVATTLNAEPSPDGGFRFTSDRGGVVMGGATAIDANGYEVPVELRLADGAIEYHVPEAFIAEAALPIVVDPLIRTWSTVAYGSNAREPAITLWSTSSTLFVAYRSDYSSIDSDIYLVGVLEGGDVIRWTTIDFTSNSWSKPEIAYGGYDPKALVIARRVVPSVSADVGTVVGRTVDLHDFDKGPQFDISDTPARDCFAHQLGRNRFGYGVNVFMVAWVVEVGDEDYVRMRTVGDESDMGLPFAASGSHDIADLTMTPVVYWWWEPYLFVLQTKDRRLYTRSVATDGHPNQTTDQYAGLFAERPRISPFVNSTHPLIPSLAVVVFERESGPPGSQRDIHCFAIDDLTRRSPSHNLTRAEDFRPTSDQCDAEVTVSGDDVIVTYRETNQRGGVLGTLRACTGRLLEDSLGHRLALQSRADTIASVRRETDSFALASQRLSGISDTKVFAVWDTTSTAGGVSPTLQFGEFDTDDGIAEPPLAIQETVCHATSNELGRNAWLSFRGDSVFSGDVLLRCENIPGDAWRYLLVSDGMDYTPATIGVGQYCLDGWLDIHTGMRPLISPGSDFFADVDLSLLPTSSGWRPVMTGETWYFTIWYRDRRNGVGTSNFSNTVSVYVR